MKNSLKNFYKNNFTYSGKEKLSKLTILFIILLNIFVFITIGLGIDFQIKVLNNPNTSFSSQCRNILNSKSLNDYNNYIFMSGTYNSKYQSIKNLEIDERCTTLIDTKLDAVKKEHDIKVLRQNERILNNKQNKINNELSYLRENYNTVLFEKMSAQKSDKSIIKDDISSENIKEKYNSYLEENEKLKKEKQNIRKEFTDSKSVKELNAFVNINKKQILDDYKTQSKSYALKKELITLIFLLPLFLLSFYIMKRYLKNEKYTLYVMFKNIVVVILIPIVISVLTLIYMLLPKVFLEKVLKFFYEIEVPFVVYYFAIAFFVYVFGYLIVKIQKRFRENQKKLEENSISNTESYNKSICFKCSNKVDYLNMSFCPCCKNELKVKCPNCNKETIKNLKHCYNCGNDLK